MLDLSTNSPLRAAIIGAILAGNAVLHSIDLVQSRQPYHNSLLSGAQWLIELATTNNQHRFHEQLGIYKEPFFKLVQELESTGLLKHTRYMSTEEQVAIFLYTVVTNLPNRKVAERFQRSGETISR
jgi:hypothetical protein